MKDRSRLKEKRPRSAARRGDTGLLLLILGAAVCLAALGGCSRNDDGMEVFVALPQSGEGWVWQTFRLPKPGPAAADTINLLADFGLITYGKSRTVEVVLAYSCPDHSGLDAPLAVERRTFDSGLLESEWVSFEFRNVALGSQREKPLAFYLFTEGRGRTDCDLIVLRTGDITHGGLYLQHRSDLNPTVVGRARFLVRTY